MSTPDAFIKDFDKLLERIPGDYSFAQWQHAYRYVAFTMALKLFDSFPEVVIGKGPGPGPGPGAHAPGPEAPAGGPGKGIGIHPTTICTIVCTALGS
jgi:hypothetical protein